MSPGRDWAELPEGRRGHRVGIDEAAGAGPVHHQDDGRLAAQVDRAHGIAVVQDVGRILAVLGPLLVAAAVKLQRRARRGGSRYGCSWPAASSRWRGTSRGPPRRSSRRSARRRPRSPTPSARRWRARRRRIDAAAGLARALAERDLLARLEGVPVDAADPGHVEGRARAEHRRGVDAAANGDVRPAPRRARRPGPVSGRHATAKLCHSATGAPSRVGAMSAPVTATAASRRNLSVGPEELAFQASPRPRALPTSRLARRKRPHVQRAGRREALLPVAEPARKVLDARLEPRLHHLAASRRTPLR